MIGVAIGLVFSAVIFTLYSKDSKAVTQFKKKKQQQEQRKKKQAQQQKQAIQKIQNDPELKKKRQQSQKTMKQRLLQGLQEGDKKLLLDYLQQKKKQGKTQAQIIKQATSKAGFFMTISMLLIVLLIFAIILMTTEGNPNVNSSRFFSQLGKMIKGVYPKFGELLTTNSTSVPTNSSNQF